MVRSALLAFGLVLAIGVLAAGATPRDDVAAAIQKLADSGDYAWRTVPFAEDAAPPDADFETIPARFEQTAQDQIEGKVQKDGLVALRAQIGDAVVGFYMHHAHMAIQTTQGQWTSETQLLSQGYLSIPDQLLTQAEFLLPPAVEARQYFERIQNIHREGDAYVGEIPQDAAIAMLEERKRKQNDGKEWRLAEAKATVKFWISDGVLSKYQVHWTIDPYICVFGLNEWANESDITETTAISDNGKTTIHLPPEAEAELDSHYAGPPMRNHPALPPLSSDWRGNVSDDEKQLASDNNAFAMDLYSHLSATPGNLFFSPFSISSAMACAYAGARGNTAAQMRQALHFSQPNARLHTAFAWESDGLNAGGTQNGRVLYQMSVANAIWGLAGYPYNQDFIRLLGDDYGAGFHTADFIGAAEQARAEINQWVEQNTNGKFKDLIAPGKIDQFTRLVLVDAIYFKGNWERPFDKSQTQDQPFHLDDQQNVTVPLMHRKAELVGLDDPDLQAVVLPYVGNKLDMVIVLPRTVTGLDALEKKLDETDLEKRLIRMPRQVDVYLPRFKLESEFALNDVLSSMGMPEAFSRTADFSGITTAERLHISFVVHKAYVNVNEEGTEAAAATGWGISVLMAPPPPPPPMVLRADHPFIFLIRDDDTGAILFMGRVTDPTK